MIELRWRKANFHPNSLEAESNSVMFRDFPVVLQYREGQDSPYVGQPTEWQEWQDVEISDD